MSDGQTEGGAENEGVPDGIVELAEEYMSSFADSEGSESLDENDVEELREEIEYWGNELESLDEGDELYSIAVEEKDSLEDRVSKYEAERERREQVRSTFLDRAGAGFVAKGEWLQPPVIKALTHAIIGETRDEILLDEYRLPDDELDNKSMFALSQNVRAVVTHSHGDERMAELWESIEGTRQYPIVEVLANTPDAIGPSEIAERMQDDDKDRRHIGDALSKMRSRRYHPYFRSDTGHTLSLLGEYVWKEFGTGDPGETEEKQDDEEDQSKDQDLTDF